MQEMIGRIAGGGDLSMDEMAATVEVIFAGGATEQEIAILLGGLRLKGETVEEIAGAATALRKHMIPIQTLRTGVVDTCGTGGDGSSTFNISTAAALVAAAAGVPVAKHGNRGITSRSGSADVLSALGVNIDADVARVERCLDDLGICFCFAPLMHGSMKAVAEVRRKMGVPTIFNLLGPLSNPASAPYQLLGVAQAERRVQMAEALAMLGTTRAVVVTGSDGLDEVTLSGETFVTEIVSGQPPRDFVWTPEEFGVERANLDSLTVSGPEESAEVIRRILAGERGPARDIVLLNAAAALWTARKVETPQEGTALAAEAIDSEAASELLARLVQWTA